MIMITPTDIIIMATGITITTAMITSIEGQGA